MARRGQHPQSRAATAHCQTVPSLTSALAPGPPHGLEAEGLALRVLEIKLTNPKLKWPLKGCSPRFRGPGLPSPGGEHPPLHLRLPSTATEGLQAGLRGRRALPTNAPHGGALSPQSPRCLQALSFLKFVSGIILINVSRTKKGLTGFTVRDKSCGLGFRLGVGSGAPGASAGPARASVRLVQWRP